MKKNYFTISIVLLSFVLTIVSCDNKPSSKTGSQDSTSIDSQKVEQKDLVADEAINQAARFYAGISKDGIQMNQEDSKEWDTYSNTIKQYLNQSSNTINGVETLAMTDFSDFRNKVNFVFYPFSAADFMYAATLFPDADAYFLCGLEKTGSLIGTDVKTNFAHYEAYRNAMATFFRSSFFITKDMASDFHNKELDGVCPIITMLMAIKDYEIISINYMKLDSNGQLSKTDSVSNVLEFKFFKKGSKHEQTLIYYSGNVENSIFPDNLKQYLSNTLSNYRVGTFLKAASYLLRGSAFSTMRDFILNNSIAVIQDDSGIPYKYFKNDFDVTLYGMYQQPKKCFDRSCFQSDLDTIYKEGTNIRPLNFRIGYNNPSNWMCARRK